LARRFGHQPVISGRTTDIIKFSRQVSKVQNAEIAAFSSRLRVPAIFKIFCQRGLAVGSNHARFASFCNLRGRAIVLAKAERILLPIFARRCGAYLALTALMLQLALSFGHAHHRDLAYPNVAFSKIDVRADWLAAAGLEVSKQAPSGLADDDEHCSICFSNLLLSNSFIPHTPQRSPSIEFKDVDRLFGRAFDLLFTADHAPFRSRGPPLS
jgi:hypothetical protein